MEVQFKGKTALVSGASQGIGRSIAIELAKSGCLVIVSARNQEALGSLVLELNQINGLLNKFIVLDYSNPDNLSTTWSDFEKIHSIDIDIYIHNTGGPNPGPAHKASTTEYKNAFNQHLISGQVMIQLLLEGMKNRGFGRIINIISTSIKAPLPNLGVSNTIRGAVAQWAKTLATELAPFGITVNNVLPGATSTLRLDGIIENRSNKSGLEKVVVREEMLNEIPAKRFGRPEEVAYAVCFLASDKASYVTGINLPVDGGRTPSL